MLGIWVVGVLLTTLFTAETAHAMSGSGGSEFVASTKIPRRQFPNVRDGMKNEFNRYFGHLKGKSRVETFRETWSRFKSFVAASATRWTFTEPLRAWLKMGKFTSVSTKEMGSRPGRAWILVDGRYEIYLIFPGTDGEISYVLGARQRTDPNDGRPLWKPKIDTNDSTGGQSEPVPDFSQPAFENVPSDGSPRDNVWPPPGAAKYGMFRPTSVS